MAQHARDARRGRPRRRWGPALEATAMFGLILIDIWYIEPRVRAAWLGLVILAFASHLRHGETPPALGFRRANFRPCLVTLAPLLLPILALALALGLTFGTVRPVSLERLSAFVTYYCAWGLFQQYVLNGYFVNRFAAAAPPQGVRLAPVIAATCFAIAHAPNWFLVAVTFGAGLLCARLYLRFRNLYPLGLAHGLLGSVLFLAVPEAVSQRFYVGPGLLRWQHAQRRLASGDPDCVAATDHSARDARDHAFAIGCAASPHHDWSLRRGRARHR